MTKEELRLEETRERRAHWQRWGPYLSERAWGTVREDYSPNGNAWEYLSHDHARRGRTAGMRTALRESATVTSTSVSPSRMWNGRDPILKERLFGLTGNEGNHGEDVKECYFYLDSTPTHSYMKYLYKYPQARVSLRAAGGREPPARQASPEFELMDTGVFAENRYFDVVVEYAKGVARRHLVRITVTNHGPEACGFHLLPTVWFRNTWSWGTDAGRRGRVARRARRDRVRASELGPAPARMRGRPRAAVHRKRDELPAPIRVSEPHSVREGRHQRVRRARRPRTP